MNDLLPVMNVNQEEEPPRTVETWIFPTSFAQRRLWFIDQVEPGSALYNLPEVFRIRGRLDPDTLERALSHVIARHEILRTTFRLIDGEPMQVVASGADFQLQVIDLRALPAAEREVQTSRNIREISERPFNLAEGPLIRAGLLGLGPSEQVLVLSLHHIITDAWSQEVLMREVTSAYSSMAAGREPALPELPIQYADFAAWQREVIQKEVAEKEMAYWRKRLDGLAPLDLPHTARHAAASGAEGSAFSFELAGPLSAAVQEMARREGVTVFMALLAAWKALLARYTGQRDIAIGTPISERGRVETEGLIGFFLNTLVMRTDLSGEPTVREALGRVRESALEAFSHQELPFEMLVEELQPVRQAGRNPLVRVMFVLMSGEEKTWEAAGAKIEPAPVETYLPKFDLMLQLRETGRTIKGLFVYDNALFDGEGIRRMASHYETLLAGMAARPGAGIHSLPLLAAGERERMLDAWNDTATPYPAGQPIDAIFLEQVECNPNAIALEDGQTEVTYGELNRRAEAVAGALIRRGVKPGEAVAISLPRSARLIAGILGILKAGAVYVPLDETYPAGRLELMLRESRARFLIGSGTPREFEGTGWLGIEACLDEAPAPAGRIEFSPASSVACIMFTSGSTGVPKGVQVLHRGISRLVINTNYIQFTPEDAVAHASNISFDATTFEIWGALLNGARLVIVPKEILLTPRELVEFLRARRITVLLMTTPLFHHFAGEIPGGFGSLRWLVVGGDALQAQAARAVLAAARPLHLVNAYGPTEASVIALTHEVTEAPAGMAGIPIGRPIANTRAYILDAALEPVPPGVTGELYLGGPGIAAGYVNNPEATAASFIPDPFSTRPGDRLYKTGDLARWNGEGQVEFLGRADNQVKIRGFRIEPGEIEAALQRHPAVRQAAVIPRTDATGQKQLVAYVVAHPGQAPAAAQLREHVLASLPEHMTPAGFVFLESLPLNANGKIAVDELPLPDLSTAGAMPALQSQNTLHSQLIEIWQEALGRKPVGLHDDFFELGGHSFLAVRMMGMVEERIGVRPRLSVLFENATIDHLADSLINERLAAAAEKPYVAIHPGGSKTPFFFLHGDYIAGGFFCRGLAREIGSDRPFYAIHPHGLLGDEPPRSISVMAAEKLALIRKIQPRGPYLLGGYCNGGLVAFEIARQLEAAGESVPAVVIFMANVATYRHRAWHRLAGAVSSLRGDGPLRRDMRFLQWRRRFEFAIESGRRRAATAQELVRQPSRLGEKMRRVMDRSSAAAACAGAPAEPLSADDRYWHVYRDAIESYVPGPFQGKLLLLWPRDQAYTKVPDPTYGWTSVCPEVNLVYVPGDHDTSLTRDANLAVVGQEMRRTLDAVDAPQPSGGGAAPARPAREPDYELVIEPSRRWIRVSWRELWDYRDLLVLLVRRDFISKYKQTMLGPAWFIIQPLLTTLMFVIIFGRVAHISTNGIPPTLFYLCSQLGWNYFAQNVTTGATTFTSNAHIFGKVYFPRVILPAAVIIANLFTVVLQFIPFLAFFVYYKFFTAAGPGLHMGWPLLLVPLILVQASLFSLGVSLWMSASTAKYRDIVHLNQFIVQLWMFASAVIYPLSTLLRSFQWLAWLNPMAAIVESLRIALLGRGTLPPMCLASSIVLTLAVTVSGVIVFQRMERTAVDNI